MKIFKAFLILMASTVLFLLPLTGSVYDFKTDQQTDLFSMVTTVNTADNITLSELLYDADVTTVYVLSDLSTDLISWSSYNATSNNLLISGMSVNSTRVLTATYDVDALGGNTAIIDLTDRLAWFWLLLIIAFAPASLAAIFTGRD